MTEDKKILSTELTDEQLDSVIETLKENKPEEAKILEAVKDFVPSETLESDIATVEVDVNTGRQLVAEMVSEEVKFNKDISVEEIDQGKDELFEKAVMNTSKESNLSDDSAIKILELVLKIQRGEKISGLYEQLPDELKKVVKELEIKSGHSMTKNQLAKLILDNFISEASLEREFIDFQAAMEKTLDIPSILDMYTEHIKDVMETKTLESADRLEEGGEVEKAELLRKVSATFTDSYTFVSLVEFLKTNRKARNHITKDLLDYKTFCHNFNYNNTKSKFGINDVYSVAPVLEKIFADDEDITLDDICKFVILFCKQCEDKDSSDVIDAAYMYYFIKNIVTLAYIDELKTDFSKNLIDNIKKTIIIIKEEEEAYNKRMSELKQNKKGGKK